MSMEGRQGPPRVRGVCSACCPPGGLHGRASRARVTRSRSFHFLGLSRVSASLESGLSTPAFQCDHLDAQQSLRSHGEKDAADPPSAPASPSLVYLRWDSGTCPAQTEAFRPPELLTLSPHVLLTADRVGFSSSPRNLATPRNRLCVPPQSRPAPALLWPVVHPAAACSSMQNLLARPSQSPSQGCLHAHRCLLSGCFTSYDCFVHRPPAWSPQDLCIRGTLAPALCETPLFAFCMSLLRCLLSEACPDSPKQQPPFLPSPTVKHTTYLVCFCPAIRM